MESTPFLPANVEQGFGEKAAADFPRPARRRQRLTTGIRLAFLAIASSLLLGLFVHAPVHHCIHRVGDSFDARFKSVDNRVRHILAHTPLIDGHNDLPILLRAIYKNRINFENFTEPFEQGGMSGHVDLPRLRKGQNGGAFWSVFTPCPKDGQDYSNDNYAESVQMTFEQIDVMRRVQQKYPRDFSAIVDSHTAWKAFKHGQFVSPLGIEGLHQIGNRASNLRQYHALGVRYATLTHNCGNKYADAALSENPIRKAKPVWGGVSAEGRLLIREMNRVGVIVDLSHTSVDTMVDVLGGKDGWEGSKAPVMFSHSSAHSLCPHPRNVPDHVLQLVKKRNSVVMVNFAPDFISCVAADRDDGMPDFYPGNNTLAQVASHVIYIGKLIGFDHVGLGSDFDGIPNTPEGLDDVSKYPDLIAELLKRGVSNRDAAKVVGGNIMRVWKEVEAVAAHLQKSGEPVLEDDVLGLSMDALSSSL